MGTAELGQTMKRSVITFRPVQGEETPWKRVNAFSAVKKQLITPHGRRRSHHKVSGSSVTTDGTDPSASRTLNGIPTLN